jgi:hypothetical protein
LNSPYLFINLKLVDHWKYNKRTQQQQKSRIFSDQSLNESTKVAAPAFSFAGKHEQKVKNIAPSPNTYNTAGLTARGRTFVLSHIFSFVPTIMFNL